MSTLWFACTPDVVALPASCDAFGPRCRVADDEVEITLGECRNSTSAAETRRAFAAVVPDLIRWKSRADLRATLVIEAAAWGVNVDDLLAALEMVGFEVKWATCSTSP